MAAPFRVGRGLLVGVGMALYELEFQALTYDEEIWAGRPTGLVCDEAEVIAYTLALETLVVYEAPKVEIL